MKKKQLETGATVILAIVCAGLIFHLVVRVRDVHAGAPPAAAQNAYRPVARVLANGVRATRRTQLAPDPHDPRLEVDLYDQLQSRTLGALDRDPFSFEAAPGAPGRIARSGSGPSARSGAAAAEVPAGPPPPPPIPFQPVGYTVNEAGVFEAYLADSKQVYAVHAGDQFDKAYRVVTITPTMIEIQDEAHNRTVEMPFAQ